MRAKMIRLFKNLQNFKDIFKKKKIAKILGGPGPPWSSSGSATAYYIYSINIPPTRIVT